MILIDAKTLLGGVDGYEMGRTSSHVWVHKDDKRIFMFYTDENYVSV